MNPGNPRNAGRKPGSSLVREVHPLFPEYCSIEGARRLKRMLEAYYRDRGLPIPEFRVEHQQCADNGGRKMFAVRSNMKNVFPGPSNG
jgi:hypothetical protein